MKLIINHLTRLNTPDSICVAGLNLDNAQHVRPVLSSRLLTRAFLADRHGYFAIGHQLDLGPVKATSQPPHTEDVCFEPGKVRRLGLPTPVEFWQRLEQTAQPSLKAIFGPDLQFRGRGAALDERIGQVSLGNLRPQTAPRLSIDAATRGEILRLSLRDADFDLNLSVTDLRFYQPDHKTPRKELVEQASQWLKEGQPIILSVGLGRAFQKPSDIAPRHWLHVNNLHFEQQPIW